LRGVAQSSRAIPRDRGEPISHPYLSILESGRDVAISPGKVLTLASVYQVHVLDLLMRIPAPLRAKLATELREWSAGQDVILDPPQAPAPLADRAVERLAAALQERSESIEIPAEHERGWRRLLPRLILRSAMPELLREQHQFGPTFPRQIKAILRTGADPVSVWRYRLPGALESAFLRRADLPGRVAALVSRWSCRCIDPVEQTVSCHFIAPELERQLGYEHAPLRLINALRQLQSVYLLRDALPELFAPYAAPPPLELAFLDYLSGVLTTRRPGETWPDPRGVARVAGLSRELAAASSTIASAAAADAPTHRAIVAVLRQAGLYVP
jgi:hypothetical protein